MTSSGILYIASGDRFIREAAISAESAHRQMPNVSIAIVADRPVGREYFDEEIVVEDEGKWRHDFGDHVSHLDRSPFDRTIKCDTDVYFDDSVADVFDLLEDFDIALAQAPLRHSTGRIDIPELNDVPEAFPEYQGGFIGFADNDPFRGFLESWQSAYQSTLETGEVSNQASLRAALYHSECRIATLPREYNCLFRTPGCVNGPVKVFHGRLIETDGKGAPKRADISQAVETINSSSDLRVYYRSGNTVKLAKPNIIAEAVESVRRNGTTYTLRRGYERIRDRFSNRS